jgi:hypothetical protein
MVSKINYKVILTQTGVKFIILKKNDTLKNFLTILTRLKLTQSEASNYL